MKKLIKFIAPILIATLSNNAFAHDENTFNAEYLGQLVASSKICQKYFTEKQSQNYFASVSYMSANSVITPAETNAFDSSYKLTNDDENSVDCDETQFNLESAFYQAKKLKNKIDNDNSFKGKVDNFFKKYGFKCSTNYVGSSYACVNGKLFMYR